MPLFYNYDPDEDLLQSDYFCPLNEIDFRRILSSSEQDALFAYPNIEPSPTPCLGDVRRVSACDPNRMIAFYAAPALVVVQIRQGYAE
jgi:hypothetical protein